MKIYKNRPIRWSFILLGLILVGVVVLSSGWQAMAMPLASITFVEPDGGQDFVAEGVDYATQEWGSPWNFDSLSDLTRPHSLQNVTVSDGALNAQISGADPNDPYFFLLFPGMPSAVNLGSGQFHPIDSGQYERAAFRFCTTASHATQGIRFYWYLGYTNGPNYHSGMNYVDSGCHIYVVDLGSDSEWSGDLTGLRFDLEGFQTGDEFSLDWFRLTQKSERPNYTIQWSDLTPTDSTLALFLDTDAAGYDGFQIGQIAGASGSGSFNWGQIEGVYPLPQDIEPGEYYVYAMVDGEPAGYSTGPLFVSQVPLLRFEDPSITSGQDYATDQGNPWDMATSADGTVSGCYYSSFGGGQLVARNTSNDPNFLFNVTTPIDTSYYRYFTIELYSNRSFYTDAGGMMRLYWFNSYAEVSTTDDLIINVPGVWRTYSIDLTTVPLEHSGAQNPWTQANWGFLRFDPNENVNGVVWEWRIRDVKLTAPPTADSSFLVKWDIDNPENESVSANWYYDTDNQLFDGTPINSSRATQTAQTGVPRQASEDHLIYLPIIENNHCFGNCLTWNTSTLATGEYYIYGCLDDGVNQVCRYSDVPVLVR